MFMGIGNVASVIDKLDAIAESVQAKGFMVQAKEIDVISNTIEKMAADIPAGSDRPAAIFPDSSSKVSDKKDHFPIPDAAHARNSLARVGQYSDAPSWYRGSLVELRSAVKSAVKSKFPSIEISD